MSAGNDIPDASCRSSISPDGGVLKQKEQQALHTQRHGTTGQLLGLMVDTHAEQSQKLGSKEPSVPSWPVGGLMPLGRPTR